MKKTKVIYWISTTLIFLFQGLMPALTSQTEMAKEGIAHLGYPAYFGVALTFFKVLGSLILIIPQVPKTLKEWAYAGFVFDFIFAALSLYAVDGMNPEVFFPFVVMAVLFISYRSFHQLQKQ